MNIRYWKEPIFGDPNNYYKCAEVGKVIFFARPYQGYQGRLGDFRAEISSSYDSSGKYFSASIWLSFPNGKSSVVKDDYFRKFKTLDEALIWAYTRLQECNNS